MLAYKTALPVETVRDIFCCETGYQTPKLDTRAAVFRDGKILLVQERDGREKHVRAGPYVLRCVPRRDMGNPDGLKKLGISGTFSL